VTALKADIGGLRRDVDELQSTDMSMLFDTVKIPMVPSVEFPTSSEIPPATTIGDVALDEVYAESEAETNEKEVGVHDAAV